MESAQSSDLRAPGPDFHRGSVEQSRPHYLVRARAFVDAAADAGCADAVKFQLFKIDRMFAPEILGSKAPSIRARREWELPLDHLGPLSEHCSARKIRFSCTPFYLDAVQELAPFVDFYKVASYELLVTDLLKACARSGRPVVLSTGMATLDEILAAAKTLTDKLARATSPCCTASPPIRRLPPKPTCPPSPRYATLPACPPDGPITPAARR